jgi:hypothetical protein
MMGSSPSLVQHNDERLIPLIIELLEQVRDSHNGIPPMLRHSFICFMNYISRIKNIAQNEMEEKIQNTTEAENQLLSTIKNNWDNLFWNQYLKQ